jgi:hypothetical protein
VLLRLRAVDEPVAFLDARGTFVARALPRSANGGFPVPRASFFAPGTPRTVWVGLRCTFAS